MKTRTLALLIAASLTGSAAQTAFAENLLQVFQRAKGYDAQFKAQQSNHQAVLEKRQQALAGFKPQLNLSGNAAYDTTRDTFAGQTVNGPAANYQLELGKSLFNKTLNANLGKTDALIAQSSALLESYRQDLITRVTNAYFATLTAQDNIAFAAAEKAAIGRQLEQTKAYFEAGRSAITDVKEAEASYAAAQAQEIAAVQQLDITREQLRVLTGGFYQALNSPRDNMPLQMPAPANVDSWVNMAKSKNNLLLASKQAINAQLKEVQVQRAAKSPNVSVYANHTGSYVDNDIYSNRKVYDAAVGVSLTMPLYTGGAISSRIREAQDNLRQTEQQYDLQSRITEQQVRSAYSGVQSSISQVQANRQALASAETAAEATQTGFEVGTRTAVDVLTSLRNVFRARRDYSSARYDYLKSLLALRQAAGTLNERDVAQVSAFMTQPPLSAKAIAKDQPASNQGTDVTSPETSAAPSAPAREPAPVAVNPVNAASLPADNSSYEYYVMPAQPR